MEVPSLLSISIIIISCNTKFSFFVPSLLTPGTTVLPLLITSNNSSIVNFSGSLFSNLFLIAATSFPVGLSVKHISSFNMVTFITLSVFIIYLSFLF